jgi:hypothetical protein
VLWIERKLFSLADSFSHSMVRSICIVDGHVWVARDGGAITIRDSSGRALQRLVRCPVQLSNTFLILNK